MYRPMWKKTGSSKRRHQEKKVRSTANAAFLAAIFAAFMPDDRVRYARRAERKPTGAEAREQYRGEHPETVEMLINLAKAKRERKAASVGVNRYHWSHGNPRLEWNPRPHKSKPEPQERGRPVPPHRSGGASYTAQGVAHG